ncbi:hypothetical protein MKZ38_009007 [Zalerion maritima]|uniref:Uncharacterized protein n=1 Tax=Zalerion maritima TaxID=339359 RepID=A0AAD5WNB9_9PEZI|nr:hypothetical protein MKZ38_009007 [Zalerion maritima]
MSKMPSATPFVDDHHSVVSRDETTSLPAPVGASLSTLTQLGCDLEAQAAEIAEEINAITSILPYCISPTTAAAKSAVEKSTGGPAAAGRRTKSPHQTLLDIEITVQATHVTLQRLGAATKGLRRNLGREELHATPASVPPVAPTSDGVGRTTTRTSRSFVVGGNNNGGPLEMNRAVWGESKFLRRRVEVGDAEEGEGEGDEERGEEEGEGGAESRYPSPPPCETEAGKRSRRRLAFGAAGEGDEEGEDSVQEVMDSPVPIPTHFSVTSPGYRARKLLLFMMATARKIVVVLTMDVNDTEEAKKKGVWDLYTLLPPPNQWGSRRVRPGVLVPLRLACLLTTTPDADASDVANGMATEHHRVPDKNHVDVAAFMDRRVRMGYDTQLGTWPWPQGLRRMK